MCHHLLAPIYHVRISKIPIHRPGPIWGAADGEKSEENRFWRFSRPCDLWRLTGTARTTPLSVLCLTRPIRVIYESITLIFRGKLLHPQAVMQSKGSQISEIVVGMEIPIFSKSCLSGLGVFGGCRGLSPFGYRQR